MRILIAAILIAFSSLEASADACFDKISKMFDTGPLDPFVRTPHSLTNTVSDADGNLVRRFLTRWQTPARSVSGVEGSGLFALVIDSDSWTGPSLDGPWTKTPNSLPADHLEVRRKQHGQERANLSETGCLGQIETDSGKYEVVTYVTQTDPNPEMNGMWFGGRHKVFIDPQTDKVMRWESTDFVSSFAPDKSKEVQLQIFEYDDALVVPRPE